MRHALPSRPSDMGLRIRVYARRMTEPHEGWDVKWDPNGFRDDIESTLQAFVQTQAEWLDELGPDAQRLVQHARTSIRGGKRFRAAFCWWGHHAVTGPESPIDKFALLRACASLELLHASALVHDDYMDASDVRRGRPATHRAFERIHREHGWAAHRVTELGDGVVSPPAECRPEALAATDARASVLDQALRVGTEPVEPFGLGVHERLQRGLDVVAEPRRVPLDVPSCVLLGHPASVDPYPQPHV